MECDEADFKGSGITNSVSNRSHTAGMYIYV